MPRCFEGRARRLRTAALALFATAAWIAVALRSPAADDVAGYGTLPPLPAIEGACDVARERARERARVAEAGALAEIARYPFDPREGLSALEQLRAAERCFGVVGDAASAARVAARAHSWHARIDRDYRDHTTRYRLALASGRTQQALADIEFLLALLAQHGGAFAEHLRQTQDTLSAESARTQEPP